jgi:putative ABC transport system permease protein
VTNSGLQNAAGPTSYFPYRQHAFGNSQTLVLRTGSDPVDFTTALRDAIWSLDPDLPLVGVQTLADRLSDSVAQPRFNSILLSVFGALAAVLAAIGIYGVMAYTVSQRTAELGLRMALGATKVELSRLVLRKAVALTVAGVTLGLLASLGLTRVIEGFLFGVEATDPVTLAAVALGLCGVAVLASLTPALRASRLDPILALREE